MSLRGDTRFSHRDANHEQIVGWYEGLYCSVLDLHTLGNGAPDLLVGIANQVNDLVEVKSEAGELEPNQVTFQTMWRGRKVVLVRTRADVENHVLGVRERLLKDLRNRFA